MKKASDHLFQLIKSLEKQEKRYFKLFASRHTIGDRNNYLQLFDAISKQEIYDEGAIKQAIGNKKLVKQFAVVKSYLHEMIMKSLDAYYSGNSAGNRLNRLLHHVEILYNKGLFDQSEKALAKAEKLAEKLEHYTAMMDILNWKFRIIKTATFHKITEKEIDALYAKKKEITKQIDNYQEYGWLYTKLISKVMKKGWFIRSKEEIKKEYDPIIRHELFSDESKAITFRSKIFYYISKSIYFYLQGDAKSSYGESSKLLQLFDGDPEIAKSYPDDYIAGYVNIIFATMAMSEYWEALQHIKKMQDFKPASIILRVQILSASLPELVIYNTTNAVDQVAKVLPQFTTRIDKYKHLMSKHDLFNFYYNFACLYFKAREYKNASRYLFHIINDSDVSFLPNIQASARILNLMVQYELNNDDLLPYILRSTYRFLMKQKRLLQFETTVLAFIKKLPYTTQDKLKQAFSNLKDELIELSQNPYEKKTMEYFGFISWLNSKIENRTFSITEK